MSIVSLDDYIAATRQRVTYSKSGTRTTSTAVYASLFDLPGNPAGVVLGVGNTANGVVHTDATAGYPAINSFAGGAVGYLGSVQFSSSVACRIALFDCLFSAGAYAFNANTTLASQPSYSSRVPGGTDFTNIELWVEVATTLTGNLAVTVEYTNQDGVTGRIASLTIPSGVFGRNWQIPLQVGDTGVQRVNRIQGATATAGTFNIHVMRRLWNGRVRVANDGDVHDLFKTGLPQVFDTSALRLLVAPDSTSSGSPEFQFEIVHK